MKLTDYEQAMLDGEHGEPKSWAMDMLVQYGQVAGADNMVAVTQAHVMCDTEALGEEGVMVLEFLAGHPEEERRVCIPTITDSRGVDFSHYRKLNQQASWVDLERRTIEALSSMGVLMTDTCISYQTIGAPVKGEHVAYGDTGTVIYGNSVCGARSNFEGGPAALAAALTGRVPRYGMHMDETRLGTHHFEVKNRPLNLSDWGVLGALIGRATGSYAAVPVISGISLPPSSDEFKHFGAALASYGSVPLFHMIGVTPEAPDLRTIFDGRVPDAEVINNMDIQAFYFDFPNDNDKVDVVVFGAPQLSLFELQDLAALLDGKTIHKNTSLLVATSPENKTACDRLGLTETIEGSGATLLKGVSFYQMYARHLARANGWQRLLTNSAKLCNIISGYGYQPSLATMEQCVDGAIAGTYG